MCEDGNSGAVGDDPGLNECSECNEALLLLSDCREVCVWYCECRTDVVGEVTRMLGLSWLSRMSLGNGTLTVRGVGE